MATETNDPATMPTDVSTRLINGFGLSSLPPDKQRDALAKLDSTLARGWMLTVADRLSKQHQQELEMCLAGVDDQNDLQAKFWAFVKPLVPDLRELLDEEVDKLLAVYDQQRLSGPALWRKAPSTSGTVPATDGEHSESVAALVDLGDNVVGMLKGDLQPSLGEEDLAIELLEGPPKLLTPREQLGWVVRTTTAGLVSISGLLWLYMLAFVVALRLHSAGTLRQLPDWLPHITPPWLTAQPLAIQILGVVVVGVISTAVVMKVGLALYFRVSYPR